MSGRRRVRVAVSAAVAAAAVLGGGAVAPVAVAPAAATVGTATGAAGTATPTATPDPVQAQEYWLDTLGIRSAWETTRGAGVRIAVVDTGIGAAPPEFAGAVAAGTDVSGVGSGDGRTPVGVDPNHGSWVASLAAARGTGAGAGMLGVAPEAELLSVSAAFGTAGSTSFVEEIPAAMRWAVDNGADVINLSFTTNTLDWDESWDDAFLYAFEHDVVVVVAAGNRGSGTNRVGAPATIPGVLTVGGVDPAGKASVEASTQGITIGVTAPSEDLLGVSADGQLVLWSGTSGAAPIVAGIAALVRAAHPDMDAANVINRIIRAATPSPYATGVPDAQYGYGIVNAAAAINADVPSVTDNPMGSLADWIRLYRRAAATPVAPTPQGQVAVPTLAPAETPAAEASPLLPTSESLRYATLPLGAATLIAILVTLGVTAAVRRIRASRRTRVSSRRPGGALPP